MKVGDIMTQEVISVAPGATVSDAAKLMLKERVSGLPVLTASGVLLGIVTEGDLLRRSEINTEKHRPHWLEFVIGQGKLAEEYVQSHGRTVSDVMTHEVVVATEDMPLTAAVELMERKRVKRLPVMRGGKVVGIIARANLLHALAASPPKGSQHPDDETIRALLARTLTKQSWSARQFHFLVKDGIVDLWGYITSERQRDAIRVAAKNVPGVVQVRDHLLWFEPYTGIVVGTSAEDRQAIIH